MKTVCKKLLCLMLVAMMLVSAVPFAFAATGDANYLYIQVYLDGVPCTDTGSKGAEVVVGETYSAQWVIDCAAAQYPQYFNENVIASTEAVTAGDGTIGTVVYLTTKVCQHTDVTTTSTATCGADGVKTTVCKDCDEVISTEDVAATGNHSYKGASCTVCGATRNAIGSVTFHYMTAPNVWTAETIDVYENAQEITPPAAAGNVRGFYFQGWSSVRNGAVDLVEGDSIVWNSGTSANYWGTYDDDADDELVHVTVKVAYYVNGKLNNTKTLLTSDDFAKNEDTNLMFRWLYKDGFDAINNALFANGDNVDYKWNEVYYLNNKGTDKVESDMMDDGDKIVYVVLNSKDYIEANVQLYVHKNESSAVYDIIDMNGYTAGDKVTRSDVIDALKDKNYSYSSLSGLYTQTEWENLLNGDNADDDKDVTITHNGTTKIHVIAKNAKTTASKADTSNPKTGDTIMIAVTAMALAAAGLVSMVELKKRKMI